MPNRENLLGYSFIIMKSGEGEKTFFVFIE